MSQGQHRLQVVRDRLGTAGMIAAALACVPVLSTIAVIALFLWPRTGHLDFLRLHYTVAYGIDWEAEWWNIFLYPVLGCLVLGINLWLATILAKRERLLAFGVLFVTVLIECALTGGAFLTVLLNS